MSAESHLKGVETFLEKNWFLSFDVNIFEIIRDRKKFSRMKIEWFQEYFREL